MINEKFLFAAVICFGIFLSLTVNATMTDGNYVMIAYDTTGSGETTTTDANYILLASAGETATSKSIADSNYNAGIGFYGSPFAFFAEAIVAPVIEAAKTLLVILPMAENSWIGIILFAMIAGFALFYVITKKKVSPTKGDEEEYVGEEEEENESEEDGEDVGNI